VVLVKLCKIACQVVWCVKIVSCFLLNLCASEREDLTRQIKDSADPQLQNDLTKLFNSIVARMEVKGEQIVKLKRCQDMVTVCLLFLPSCHVIKF